MKVLVAQSCPPLASPWAAAHQAPLSVGFSQEECWNRLPFSPPEDLPDPGIEPTLLCLLHCRQILYCWAIGEAHASYMKRKIIFFPNFLLPFWVLGWESSIKRPTGMGWGGRRERGSEWGIHVNPWLIHVNAWQKPLHYCKVISLQLIKVNGKKFFKKGKLTCISQAYRGDTQEKMSNSSRRLRTPVWISSAKNKWKETVHWEQVQLWGGT